MHDFNPGGFPVQQALKRKLMNRSFAVAASLLALSLLTACAGLQRLKNPDTNSATNPDTPAYSTVERMVAGCAADEKAFDCDRRAILAMLGGYEVQFIFDETVVLQPGYERKKPKRTMGFESVKLVEDTGTRISLQHILVMGGGALTKHWRQDWVYESPKHWVFVGNQRFEEQARKAADVPGTWTQLVYEVNDGPRYAGDGKWNHRYGISTWTSDRTWRPLPRREYTTRSDYQLINGENRHTITPQGWAHEQDNTKVIRAEDGTDTPLVREFGFNDYRRIKGFDFGPATAYWNETSPFWADVRARWARAFAAAGNTITLSLKTGDEDFNKAVHDLADEYRKKPQMDLYKTRLDNLFRKYVNVKAPAPAAKP